MLLTFGRPPPFPIFSFTYPITRPNRSPAGNMDCSAESARGRSLAAPLLREEEEGTVEAVSLREWQGWGTSSPVPAMVTEVIRNMKALQRDIGDEMTFGGLGGKLQGNFKVQEDKKHRAVYESLNDSEKKQQFFSARQIACRLLGSRGYLCQKCWLAMEDCMCSKLVPCSLWHGIRFWLYMHPKDFLRQNNTGKLLWQVFGIEAASLCLFGVQEHEEIMWDAFKSAGKGKVWFLYPNKNAPTKSIEDIFDGSLIDGEHLPTLGTDQKPLNFVLIDGTWSNSAAMFSRLKEHGKFLFGEDGIPCISLTSLGASAMHKLRPQPSWDRTCTAAAAIGLLSELYLCPQFSMHGLDSQAEAVENALEILLNGLTTRRRRMGRSITRKERNNLF